MHDRKRSGRILEIEWQSFTQTMVQIYIQMK